MWSGNSLPFQSLQSSDMEIVFDMNTYHVISFGKKRLKIPKRQSESIYIEEEQTTQWSKEKAQKDKQRPTKHTHKTKDRVTRTLLI